MEPTREPTIQYVGSIREFGPKVSEIPTGPKTKETKDLFRRGQLWWAGNDYLRPGLYMWTGKVYVLIESKQNILVKMEGALGSPDGPVMREDYQPPKPHNERKEGEEE